MVRDGGTFVGVQPQATSAVERGITAEAVASTPAVVDWPNCARGPFPASYGPESVQTCRWTTSPTPTGPWPRAGYVVAMCSSPDPGVHALKGSWTTGASASSTLSSRGLPPRDLRTIKT